jgi:predicted Zn-dependent protease
VQLGKEAASEVRKQYPIIGDQHIAKYLTQIGNRLVAAAPTETEAIGLRVLVHAGKPERHQRVRAAGRTDVRANAACSTRRQKKRNYEKRAHLLGAQIMARAGHDPRALAHAPSRSASIRLNKTATWFQMALFWSTILRS